MDASPRSPSFRRAVPWLAAFALVALALAGGRWLPDAGLRWGVVEGLRALGMAEVALGGADLSLFQGRVVVRGVSARAGSGTPLDLAGALVDFRWRPLLDKRLSLRTAELQGVRLDARRDGDAWVVNGLPLPLGGAAGGGWSFEADALRLADSRLVVEDGGVTLDVDITALTIDNLRGWDPEAELSWRLEGRINGAAMTVEGTAAPFAAKPRLALTAMVEGFDLAALRAPARRSGIDGLSGKLSARMAVAAGDGPVRAKGSASVAKAAAAAGAVALAGGFEWKGVLAWRPGAIEADGALRAEALRVTHPDGGVDVRSAEWAGVSRTGGGGRPFEAEGKLDLAGMVGRLGEHRVDHARAGVTGRLAVVEASAADTVMPPLEGAVAAWVEGLRVEDPAHGRAVAAADKVTAAGVVFSPAGGARAARIEAAGLAAKDGRVRIARAVAEDGVLSVAGAVTVASLGLEGVSARLVRTADGFEGFPAAEGEGGGEPPRVALGRLKVAGGTVEFEDRTPSEPVRLRLDGIEVSVRGLDTAQPGRDSPFRLSARLQGAKVAARGVLRPFAPSPSGSVTGRIEALDLPPLSPYAADSLGVHLHTGQFDGELAVSLERGELDGRMDIVLSKLFVAQPDPKAPLAVQADMPVETVLDLLRDSEQRIRLTIPVRGDLSRPDFDVSDAVSQAVGGALKSTVVTTLKVAFPVVALIGFVIDEASTPRLSLEPLAFQAGEHGLAPAHVERLETVAALLRQRPGVKLNVCGVATASADWPVLAERRRRAQADLLSRLRAMVGKPAVPAEDTADRDALAELADRRAQAVKAWLVDQGRIDPGRLFLCRPRVSEEVGTAPRVDLLI